MSTGTYTHTHTHTHTHRIPHERLLRYNHRLAYEYGDTLGILVDLKLRKVGFVKNGVLLHENTVYDLPTSPLRFVASLYDAGAVCVFGWVGRWVGGVCGWVGWSVGVCANR
jgi:hypothetical protein